LTPQQPFKACPRCQAPAELAAPECASCGHRYRTQFVPAPSGPSPEPEPTRAYSAAPSPQPPAPQQYYAPPPQLQLQSGDLIRVPPGTHATAAAGVLGFFITGAGQLVNRQYLKAVALCLGAILVAAPTSLVGSFVIWLVAFIDAIAIAGRLNRGEAVRPWQFF
jgi:hypothetical protein